MVVILIFFNIIQKIYIYPDLILLNLVFLFFCTGNPVNRDRRLLARAFSRNVMQFGDTNTNTGELLRENNIV